MSKHLYAAAVLALCAFGCERRDRGTDTTIVEPTPAPVAPKTDMPSSEQPPVGGGPAATDENAGSGMLSVSIEGAADRMAEAHCEVAMRCDQLGKGKKAGDPAKCMDDWRKTASKGMDEKTCAHGVDGTKLSTCLDAIRNGGCTDATSAVESMTSCATAEICAK